MSFCKTCQKKNQCDAICESLEIHLQRETVYQREVLFDPGVMDLLLERATRSYGTWADLFPDYPWMWDRIIGGIMALPPPLLTPFLLHYYDGRTLTEVGHALNLHRSTIDVHLNKAIEIIKDEIQSAAICDSSNR